MNSAHPIPPRITHHETSKLQSSINSAPTFSGKVASALKHTIETLHGLPVMHTTLKLKDIEIYIGKSERTPHAVLKRWMDHRKRRKHMFGIVLFRCSLQNAKKLERVAIRVVKALKQRNSLCVGEANLSEGSAGRNPASNDALIYMTWAPLPSPTAYVKPTMNTIREVARSVAPALQGTVKADQIERGLAAIKRPSCHKKSKMNCY